MDRHQRRRRNLERLIAERSLKSDDWRKISVDPNYLSRVKRGVGNLGDKEAAKICEGLHLPTNYFDRDISEESIVSITPANSIPILTLHKHYDSFMAGKIAARGFDYMAIEPSSFSSTAFAIAHEGQSMNGGARPIHDGDLCIIEPAIEPEKGNIVAAYIAKDDQYVVRTLDMESGKNILVPQNPTYGSKPLAEKDKIIGVVISVHWKP